MGDVPASVVIWTAAITAGGSVLGALVGGWLSYLATTRAEERAAEREARTQLDQWRAENLRDEVGFQRRTTEEVQDALTELWGVSTAYGQVRREALLAGARQVDSSLPVFTAVADARVRFARVVERIEGDNLRETCWRAASDLGEFDSFNTVEVHDAVKVKVAKSMIAASEALGHRLRDLYRLVE